MSELVSSAQLAEMALPILPKSKQGIEHVAKRDGWPFEYIKGQGRGGRLKKFVFSGLWKKLPQIMQQRGRMTGAAYKSLLPYIRRDWQALRPNDVWIGDGHSFKAKVQHPIHGQPFMDGHRGAGLRPNGRIGYCLRTAPKPPPLVLLRVVRRCIRAARQLALVAQ